ncbi:MAG: DUF4398 domain-containing protein [Myxococcales bacterium]|jgi:hypothetical protein
MTKLGSLGLTLALLAALVGCGSYPAPTERMTTTEAAIRAAAEVGASNVPRAALHLKLAEEQTEKAERLIQDGYNQRAELTLKRAQADAELAIAIAKEAETLEEARKAQAKVQQMKAAALKASQR